MRCPQAPQRQSGFSLMELTIGVVLLGMLGVIGSTMIASSFFTTRVIGNEQLAYSAARYAMERMRREVREIRYDATSGTVKITAMSASQLSFEKSGVAGNTDVTLQYLSPSISLVYPPAAAATLSNDISSFAFTYLDANRQVTAVANSVRYIRIAFTVSPSQAQPLSLVTQVSLRNL